MNTLKALTFVMTFTLWLIHSPLYADTVSCHSVLINDSSESVVTVRLSIDDAAKDYPAASFEQIQATTLERIQYAIRTYPALPWPKMIDVQVFANSSSFYATYNAIIISHDFVLRKQHLMERTFSAQHISGFTFHELGHLLFLQRALQKMGIELKDYSLLETNPFRDLVNSLRDNQQNSEIMVDFLDSYNLLQFNYTSSEYQEFVADLFAALVLKNRDYLHDALVVAGIPSEDHHELDLGFVDRGFYKTSELPKDKVFRKSIYTNYHPLRTRIADHYFDKLVNASPQVNEQFYNLVLDACVELAVALQYNPFPDISINNQYLIHKIDSLIKKEMPFLKPR
ncbi:MAG: hypothetical protein KDD40_02135 [Bdellovibrionales bacterium]|nr:hypothetical protein [Bdellovibrionales bacterium]